MTRSDRILSATTTMIVGAAVALIVSVITPGSHGDIAGWTIIGAAVGLLIGLPLWSSIWRRHQLPQRR